MTRMTITIMIKLLRIKNYSNNKNNSINDDDDVYIIVNILMM